MSRAFQSMKASSDQKEGNISLNNKIHGLRKFTVSPLLLNAHNIKSVRERNDTIN